MELEGNWLFRYRSWLPIVVLLVGVTVYIGELHNESFAFRHPHWAAFEAACLLLGFVGLAVRAYTVGHTPAGTSGRNTDGQLADSLNTTGAYSMVRNPLYLGNFLMWLSVALLTREMWFVAAFTLLYWLYYERIIFAEECFLAHKFGVAYAEWAARTPAFIPSLAHFRRAAEPMSWRKVLKKEKNGLFALCLTFAAFDALRAMMTGGAPSRWLLGLAVLSGVAYGVLEFFKKCTHVLDQPNR